MVDLGHVCGIPLQMSKQILPNILRVEFKRTSHQLVSGRRDETNTFYEFKYHLKVCEKRHIIFHILWLHPSIWTI